TLISRFFIQLRGAVMDDDVAIYATNHHLEMSHQRDNSQPHFQLSRVGIGSIVRYTQQVEHEHHPIDTLYLDNDDKVIRHDYPSHGTKNSVKLQELRRMRAGRVTPRY
ncbi:2894_t:CDS:1, partial [Acaulospora colombiana]